MLTQNIFTFISNHWILCAAFIVVLCAIVVYEMRVHRKKPMSLLPHMVVRYLNDENAVLLDIRPKKDYDQGHILHATWINTDNATQTWDAYESKPVIVVCMRGIRAQQFAAQLRKTGLKNVMVLQGGMEAWRESGLPVIKTAN